jgi:hypothetical protein
VPFRDYSGFNDKTLKHMTAAYDAALAKLGIDATSPLSSNLAAVIASLAAEGERDAGKLCDRALASLKGSPKKKTT